MIKTLGQVMLYVEDVNAVKEFWLNQVGFELIEEHKSPEMHYAEIAPTAQSETHFVLFERAMIEKSAPELNFGTPSLMFRTEDANALYQTFQAKGITVGELVERGESTVFNFADVEGNYFAVTD